jgi:hypothetical protein
MGLRLYPQGSATIDAAVEEAVEAHTPGATLGFAERATVFTATANSDIPTLSVTVIGQGRPVDVRFYCSRAYHSVANTLISARIKRNGTIVQEGSILSPVTTGGPSMHVLHTETLTNGVSYTYTVQAFQGAAGTMTFGVTLGPMHLSVTSR